MCLDAPSDCWTVEPEAEVKTAQSRVTKIQWQRWLCMTIGSECFRTTSRRSLHGDHGRAQSLETNWACKNSQKSHSHGKRSIAQGKLVLPSLVAWRACTKIRDAPAEKRRDSKVQRSSTRTEMLFLWCFSAPSWERIVAASGAHCKILSHIMLLNVWNWSLLRSKGKVQNWVPRRSHNLNLCEAHGLNTWGQLPHLMKNDRTFSVMRRTSRSSLSRVLSTRSSCCTSRTSPTSLSQTMKNILSVQRQCEVRIWVNKHKETCYKPSLRTTNKHGETRYRLGCHEGRCNGGGIHTHFLKDRNCEMQEG